MWIESPLMQDGKVILTPFPPPGPLTRRRGALLLIALLAVCAGVRIWLVGHTEVITKDGVALIDMAIRWEESPAGAIEEFPRPPGYPAVVSWVHGLVVAFGGPTDIIGWDLAGQITSVVAAVGAMAAIWLFARWTMDWRVAWIAVLLFSCARKWSVIGADVIRDALAVCLQMWAVVGALWALRLFRRRGIAAMLVAAGVGALIGTAYLVRLEAMHFVVVIAACWLFCAGWRRKRWFSAIAATVVMVAATLVCVVPYMVAIGGLTKGTVLDNLLLMPFQEPAACVQAGLALPLIGPISDFAVIRFAGQLMEAMHAVIWASMCIWLITWLGAKVLKSDLLDKLAGRPAVGGVVIMIGSVAIMGPATIIQYWRAGHLSHRYLMPNAALLVVLGGAGVIVVAQWLYILGRLLKVRLGQRAAVWMVVGVAGVGMLLHTLKPMHEGKAYIRQAGQRVAELAGEGDFLFTDRALILHYAQMPGRVLPPQKINPEFVHARVLLHEPEPTFVVVSDRRLPGRHATLSQVLDKLEGFNRIVPFPGAGRNGHDVILGYRIDHAVLPQRVHVPPTADNQGD